MPTDRSWRVCFVCTGNICRSPMAEVVMRSLAQDAGLADRITVDSAGTGDWHPGEPADPRAIAALAERGYEGREHRARAFHPDWFGHRDLIVALDRSHLKALTRMAPPGGEDRLRLLRSFDPTTTPLDPGDPRIDVPDPYFDGPAEFELVLDQVEAACAGLLDRLLDGTTQPPRQPPHR